MICYKGHIKCWFSSSSSSRLLWTQLNVPSNCPFFLIVYLPCTSHQVLLNHYAAFCLDKFWAKGTSSLVNIIFVTPGVSVLERGITLGKFCAPHTTMVKILCKQSGNFVEGAVTNYKVILSLSMRLQIVANHQDCFHCDTLALPYNAIWFQCSFHFYMIHLWYMGGGGVLLWMRYRMAIHLSNGDTLIEWWYTYRMVIHLSNSDTLIEN